MSPILEGPLLRVRDSARGMVVRGALGVVDRALFEREDRRDCPR